MSYSRLFEKASRILKSYINSIGTDDNEDTERKRKIYEDYIKREAYNQRTRQSYQYQNSNQQSRSDYQSNTKNETKSDLHYYQVFGLKQNATNDEIKKAYKTLMSQYHPDKVVNLGVELQDLAKKKTQEINEAYQYIRKTRNF